MANGLQDGLPLLLHDDIGRIWFEVDRQMMLNGMKQYLERHTETEVLEYRNGSFQINEDRLDSDAADSMLQYAAFGWIKYKKGVEINS